jgi:hypothetical protein
MLEPFLNKIQTLIDAKLLHNFAIGSRAKVFYKIFCAVIGILKIYAFNVCVYEKFCGVKRSKIWMRYELSAEPYIPCYMTPTEAERRESTTAEYPQSQKNYAIIFSGLRIAAAHYTQ